MSDKITKNTVLSSLIWKFLERGGAGRVDRDEGDFHCLATRYEREIQNSKWVKPINL